MAATTDRSRFTTEKVDVDHEVHDCQAIAANSQGLIGKSSSLFVGVFQSIGIVLCTPSSSPTQPLSLYIHPLFTGSFFLSFLRSFSRPQSATKHIDRVIIIAVRVVVVQVCKRCVCVRLVVVFVGGVALGQRRNERNLWLTIGRPLPGIIRLARLEGGLLHHLGITVNVLDRTTSR